MLIAGIVTLYVISVSVASEIPPARAIYTHLSIHSCRERQGGLSAPQAPRDDFEISADRPQMARRRRWCIEMTQEPMQMR